MTRSRGLLPLLAVSATIVLVTLGAARGAWLANLHNGLLALAFTLVGAYVLFQRPGHREGVLLLANGVVSALLFSGRQVGHFPAASESPWWGWLGTWPVAVAIALTTVWVICFPDGRLPSRGWRWVIGAVVATSLVCALLSALWPVEYDATGVLTEHPINEQSPSWVVGLWGAIAHPAYALFQALWLVAIVVRWRDSSATVRRQLIWLLVPATCSLAALVVGFVGWHSPRAGLLAAALVPVAAGAAIVHGQHATAYAALTWLSRTGSASTDLPTDLARATAEALGARAATVWIRVGGDELHAVGVWPEDDEDVEPVVLDLVSGPRMRVIARAGEVTGALTFERTDALSLAEGRLFDDLAAQAALVIDHLVLAEAVATGQTVAVDGLTPREGQVLELMARGLSNAAMCEELHLSIKTVEPIVSTIFVKLGLHPDAASNRRVLAVLAYLRR